MGIIGAEDVAAVFHAPVFELNYENLVGKCVCNEIWRSNVQKHYKNHEECSEIFRRNPNTTKTMKNVQKKVLNKYLIVSDIEVL